MMAKTSAREFNFDGLVGPTHNYAGLSLGNVASSRNVSSTSNPKQAALQGLEKMRALAAQGFAQAVLPPQTRPNLRLLRSIGFGGSDAEVVGKAFRQAPSLLASAYSASSMWTANAATVSPSADTADGRVHITVANLNNKLHRSQEYAQTCAVLRAIFGNERHFLVHEALPQTPAFGDEGAANHTRLCADYASPGTELFVYGRAEFGEGSWPTRFPARQTREASEAVARLHRLDSERVVLTQQHPGAIDRGVFHNDVIAVGNRELLLYHEKAFADEEGTVDAIAQASFRAGFEPRFIRVSEEEVSLDDAVSTYLFNSQILSRERGGMTLVVPQECMENRAVASYLSSLTESGGPINETLYFDLRQSMRNGGGPACLRLRVVLGEEEMAAMHRGIVFDEALYQQLTDWVNRHYRDRLSFDDLADPALILEVRTAMEDLAAILSLPIVAQLAEE
jgi:succinylarginine dihydrolase